MMLTLRSLDMDEPPTRFQPERLLKLADLLQADARQKNGVQFYLGTWGEVTPGAEDILSCGTQACAFGLAALSGAFKRAGLSYELSGIKHRNFDPRNQYQDIKFLWKGEVQDSPLAVAAHLFGLTYNESSELFSGGDGNNGGRGAVSERAVAKRIRKLVKAVQNLKKGEPRALALDALRE